MLRRPTGATASLNSAGRDRRVDAFLSQASVFAAARYRRQLWVVESGPATWPCANLRQPLESGSSTLTLLITTTAAAPPGRDALRREDGAIHAGCGVRLAERLTAVAPCTPSSAEITRGSPVRCGIEPCTTRPRRRRSAKPAPLLMRLRREGVLLLAREVLRRGVVLLGEASPSSRR